MIRFLGHDLKFLRHERFVEECVSPGDEVIVFGPATRVRGTYDPSDEYRDTNYHPGALSIRAGEGFENELILANVSPRALLDRLVLPFVLGIHLVVLGVALLVVTWVTWSLP
jgi:hypothetical protein